MKIDKNSIKGLLGYNPDSIEKAKLKFDVNHYLAKAAYRYNYLKKALCLLLVIVMLAFVLGGNLSYDNFYYLAKDIKLSSDYVSVVHDTITYNVGNSQEFSMYRGGLAVASREGFSIFSASGREISSSNHDYANPTLVSSNKHIILYDLGGKKFSLYNSFSKVREEILDYSIYGATIANSGDFAVITRSEDYDCVVRYYKQNGKRIDYSFAEGYVSSVALSKNGSKMALTLIFGQGDNIRSELRVYNVGSKNYSKAEISFSGIPSEVKVWNNGNICVVGSGGVNVFNGLMIAIEKYIAVNPIYAYSIGDTGIAIAHSSKDNSKSQLVLINNNGRITYDEESGERVMDVKVLDRYLFAQTLDGFVRIDTRRVKNIKELPYISVNSRMLVIDKDTAVVCGPSYARFINFGK